MSRQGSTRTECVVDTSALVNRLNAISDPLRAALAANNADCDGDEPARGVDSDVAVTLLRRVDALIEDIAKGLVS